MIKLKSILKSIFELFYLKGGVTLPPPRQKLSVLSSMWILPPFAFATLDSLIELFNERSAGIVYDLAKHSRHKLRDVRGRKELPCGTCYLYKIT